MTNDAIVEEIHQIRAQLLQQHGGDFAAYFASLMQKQQQHPERYASFAQTTASGQNASLKPARLDAR
jgi:hypothetical protein